VYRFYDESGVVVYVGKAKDLRRRLAQYRLAGPGKRGRKPRKVVKEAVALDWDLHESELDACLAEIRLIQTLRPRHNVVSAFEFLYPLIGQRRHRDTLRFCYTTSPESFDDYALHGTFRSREVTREAFFALMRLLGAIGHPEPRGRLDGDDRRAKHSHVYGFRRLPAGYAAGWSAFWRGEDDSALGELAVRLLEKPSARARAHEVQADLRALATFYAEEAAPLRAAVERCGMVAWPVPQQERDPLFLRARAGVAPG
jgi:excinuclease ABC subunit C